MQTKLTLRMEQAVIEKAKAIAARRGKSVSQMIADYILGFSRGASSHPTRPLTPIVASMRGLLRGKTIDAKRDWHRHLEEKYR